MSAKRISYVTLAVDDVDEASTFWREAMGLVERTSPPGMAFFDAGGVTLALLPREMLAAMTGRPASIDGCGTMVSWNVESPREVDELLRSAEQAGATVTSPAAETSWGGYAGLFTDPDGHCWEVVWNPKFDLGS